MTTSAILANPMSTLDIIFSLCVAIGGLGVFMFGMKIMGDGLETMAGSKLRTVLSKSTDNRFKGVAVGAGITSIIQSSSATTVMLVGFVNVGLMTLTQAAAVIMGANIGTTITLQIVSLKAFKVSAIFAATAGIGFFMNMFSKKPKVKQLGIILVGLGMLFIGLDVMGKEVGRFSELEGFGWLFQNLNNPFLLLLVGLVFTAIIQSSSAATTILVSFVAAGTSAGMSVSSAFYAILGMNIGTCVTALLASIGANPNAKRTAVIHLLFNVFGSVIMFILLISTNGAIVKFFEWISGGAPARQLANFHTIFNVLTTLVLLPFIKPLVALSKKIVRGKEVKESGVKLKYLDERILSTPTIAVSNLGKEIDSLAQTAKLNLDLAVRGLIENDVSKLNEIKEREDEIDFLSHSITEYLVKVSSLDIPFRDEQYIGTLFHVVADIERIGDYADNLINYAGKMINHSLTFSKDALNEINYMYDLISSHYALTMKAFLNGDISLLPKINSYEEKVDQCKKDMSDNHIKRLSENTCGPEAGAIYLSIASNLERVADHLTNIAFSIKTYTKEPKSEKKGMVTVDG